MQIEVFQSDLDGGGLRIGVVQARFNQVVCEALRDACLAELIELGVEAEDVFVCTVPGSLEIPVVLQQLAASGEFDALIALGASPFIVHLLPRGWRPDAGNPRHGVAYGLASMSLMLLTGVAGPLLDSFFLGGRLDRRAIVATKAACQVLGHGLKLVYFGGMVANTGAVDPVMAACAVLASMLGTMLARPLLAALSEQQFRLWAGRIVTTIACYYVGYGTWLAVVP